MQETLLGYVPGILAIALAVVLRLRRSRREASEEIAARRKKIATKIAALEYPDRRRAQLARFRSGVITNWEQELAQARERATTASLRGQKEVDEAFHRLEAIKARMPFDGTVEEKYIVEVETIVERLQQATGMDLNRWLGIPPSEAQRGAAPRVSGIRCCDRDFLRFKILSLLAFCNYHFHRSQPSRLIH
jgi:hypothetical protein